jgi:two-component system, response regulator RegA
MSSSIMSVPSMSVPVMPEKSLLILDDDKAFLMRLARAMEARGYTVVQADSVSAGLAAIAHSA